ncbi:hypothetical protein KP509_39G054200 [Ceratopteris richardii]|nr:hypothetical protein KP509_39G054200 [Ceratopteris richardii]
MHSDRILKLKEKMKDSESKLKKRKVELAKKQQLLDVRSRSLALASAELAKKQVEQLGQHDPNLVQLDNINSELHKRRRLIFRQLCRVFPLKPKLSSSVGSSLNNSQLWTICGVQLPIRDDPQSVGKQELGTSLGYLLQLVQLAASYLCTPLLHDGRLNGSFSSIWQRTSYWNATCSRSGEYPLYTAKKFSLSDENTFSDNGASIMGFSNIEGIGEERIEIGYDSSYKYGSSSVQNLEMHAAVQKGIKLLKQSVGCITYYGFNELLPSSPSNMTTLQAFSELLHLLSEREVKLRAPQRQLISSLSDSTLSTMSSMDMHGCSKDHKEFKVVVKGNSDISSSFYYIGRDLDYGEGKFAESCLDEWDLVEHITLPPPPSNSEDVEHWTRAMIVDATK